MGTVAGARKRRRTAEVPEPPRGTSQAPEPIAGRVNDDFVKRYDRQPNRRIELIRFTAHARFMGRWSAP